jgi:hypothetical protein
MAQFSCGEIYRVCFPKNAALLSLMMDWLKNNLFLPAPDKDHEETAQHDVANVGVHVVKI